VVNSHSYFFSFLHRRDEFMTEVNDPPQAQNDAGVSEITKLTVRTNELIQAAVTGKGMNKKDVRALGSFARRIHGQLVQRAALFTKAERKVANAQAELKQAQELLSDAERRADLAERQVRSLDRELSSTKRRIAELESRGD
jgi:chromosome segregation ATPase